MTEDIQIQKSLVQQIYDEMFSKIEGQEEFDISIIDNIKRLAANGELKKPQKVSKAIKSITEEDYETA